MTSVSLLTHNVLYMFIVYRSLIFITVIAIATSIVLLTKGQKPKKSRAQKSPYTGIYIQPKDILDYRDLELTCRVQTWGRIGTKRIIITDKTMQPLILFLRMSPNREWYRLDMTHEMRQKAKNISNTEVAQRSLKMTRCRQTDLVDEILSMAINKKRALDYLITQNEHSRIGDLLGEGVRLKRRRLMTILDQRDKN